MLLFLRVFQKNSHQYLKQLTHLFDQLGLDSSETAIQSFIVTHQLDAETSITQANIWTEAQRQFLSEKIKSDGEWAIVVDQLNEALHEDASA